MTTRAQPTERRIDPVAVSSDPGPEDVAVLLARDGAVVLRGVDVRDDERLLAAASLAGRPSSTGNAGVLIFDVTPRPDGTDLSSTAATFPLHTDSTFLPEPHAAIALGCVEAAGTGGLSCVVTARDACAALDDATLAALSEPVFPFITRDGRSEPRIEARPVVTSDADGAPLLRYRGDAILMAARAAGTDLHERHLEALRVFGEVTADEAPRATIALRAGDVLLVDNRRALHGRTAIGDDERRLMRRIKLDAAGGPGSTGGPSSPAS